MTNRNYYLSVVPVAEFILFPYDCGADSESDNDQKATKISWSMSMRETN